MTLQYVDALVTIAALDFDNLVQFYQKLLAQTPLIYQPGIYAEFQLIGLRLGIFKPKDSHSSEFAHSAGSGLSLCLEVKDLEAAIAFLTEMGYPLANEIALTSHGKEIYAYDPAANRLILYQSFKQFS